MNREMLKWIAAAATSALVMGLRAFVPALQSTAGPFEVMSTSAIIMIATRLAGWLVSKMPVSEPAPSA